MRTLPIALRNTAQASGSTGILAPALLTSIMPPDPMHITLESVETENVRLCDEDYGSDAIRYSTSGLTYLMMRECFRHYPQQDTDNLVRAMADYLERHDAVRESKQPNFRQKKVPEIYSVLMQSLWCQAYPQKRDKEPHFLGILNDFFKKTDRIPHYSELPLLIDRAFEKCLASRQHEATPPHHFTYDLANKLVTFLKTKAQKREEAERKDSSAAFHDGLLRKGLSAVNLRGKGKHKARSEKRLLITALYCILRHHLPECEPTALSDLSEKIIKLYARNNGNVTLINNLCAMYHNKAEYTDLIVLVQAIRQRGLSTTMEELKEILGESASPQKLQLYTLQQLASCTDELIKHTQSGKGEFPVKLNMPPEATMPNTDDVRRALALPRVQEYQSIKQATKNVIKDLPHVVFPSLFAGVKETPEYQQNKLDRAYLLKICVSAALPPAAHDVSQQKGNHELAEHIISILSDMPDVDAEDYLWHSINEHVVRMQHHYSCEAARHRLDICKNKLKLQRAELEKDRQVLQKIRLPAVHVDDSYARSCIQHGEQIIKDCGREVNDAAKVLNVAKKNLMEFNCMATGLNFEKIARSKVADFTRAIGLTVRRAKRMQKFSLQAQHGQLTELILALATFFEKTGTVASGGQKYAITADRAKTLNRQVHISEWMRYAQSTPSEMWNAWRAGLPLKRRVPEGGNPVISQLNMNDEMTFKREALHQLSRLSGNTSVETYDEVASNLMQLAGRYRGGSAGIIAGNPQPQAPVTPEDASGSVFSSAMNSVRESLKMETSESAWPLPGASGNPAIRRIPCPEGTGRTSTGYCNPLFPWEFEDELPHQGLTRDVKLSLLAAAADASSRQGLYNQWNCDEEEVESLKILLCGQYHIYDEHECNGQALIRWMTNWKKWTWPSGTQPVGILRDVRPLIDPKNPKSGSFSADFPPKKNFLLTLKNQDGDTVFQKAYTPDSSLKEDIWHEDICNQINRDMQRLPENQRIKCQGISYESYGTLTPYISSGIARSSYRNVFMADSGSQVCDAAWRFISTNELSPQHRLDVDVSKIEKKLTTNNINNGQNSRVRRQYILNMLSDSLQGEKLRCDDSVAVYNDAEKSTNIMTLDRYLYDDNWQSPSFRVSLFGHANPELPAILSNPHFRQIYKHDKLTFWSPKEHEKYKSQLKRIGLTEEEIRVIHPRESITLTFEGKKNVNPPFINKYIFEIEDLLDKLVAGNLTDNFIGYFTELSTTHPILKLKLRKYLLDCYPHLDDKNYVKEKLKKRRDRAIDKMVANGEVITSHRLNQRMIDEIQTEILTTSSPAHMEEYKLEQIASIVNSDVEKKRSLPEKNVTESVVTVVSYIELLSIYSESESLQRQMSQEDFIDACVVHTTPQGKEIISLIQYLSEPGIKDSEINFPGPLDGGTAIYLQEAKQKVQSVSKKTDALSKAFLKWEDIRVFINPVSNYVDEKFFELIASVAPNAANLSPDQVFNFKYMKPEYNGDIVIERKFLSKKFTLMEIYRGIKRQWESEHPSYKVYLQQPYQSVIDALESADIQNDYSNTLNDEERRKKLVEYIDFLNVALRPEHMNAIYTFKNAPGLMAYAYSGNTPRTGDDVQGNDYRIVSLLTGQHLDFSSVSEMEQTINKNETYRGFFLYHFPDGDNSTLDLSTANVYNPFKLNDIRHLHNEKASMVDDIINRKKEEMNKFVRSRLETNYDAFVYGFQSVSYFHKAVNALIGTVAPPLGYLYGQLMDLPMKLSKFLSSDNTDEKNYYSEAIKEMLWSFLPTVSESDVEGIGFNLKMLEITPVKESGAFKLREDVAEKINKAQGENMDFICLEAKLPSDATTCIINKGTDAKYKPVNNGVYKGTFFFNQKYHIFANEKEFIPVIWSCADEGFIRIDGGNLENIQVSESSKVYKIENGELREYEKERTDVEITECPAQPRRINKRSPSKFCYPSLNIKSKNVESVIDLRYESRKRAFEYPENNPTARQIEELRRYKIGKSKGIVKISDVDTDSLSSIELKDLSTRKTEDFYDFNSEQFGEFVSLIEEKIKEEHINKQTKLIQKVYRKWANEGYDVKPFPQNILILTGSSIVNSGRCLPLSQLMALALDEGAENKFVNEVIRYSESPGIPETIKFNNILQDIHSDAIFKEYETVLHNPDSSRGFYSINEAFTRFRDIGTSKKYFFKIECTGGESSKSTYSGHTMLISYIPETNGNGGTYHFYDPNFGVISTDSIIKIKNAVSYHLINRGLAEKYNAAINDNDEFEFKLTEMYPRLYKDVTVGSVTMIDVVSGKLKLKKDTGTHISYEDYIELSYEGAFSVLKPERSTDIVLDFSSKEYNPRVGTSIYTYDGNNYIKSGNYFYMVTSQNGGATYRLKLTDSIIPGPELIYLKEKGIWLINNQHLAGGGNKNKFAIRIKVPELRFADNATIDSYIQKVKQKYKLNNDGAAMKKITEMANKTNEFKKDKIEILQQVLGENYISFEAEGTQGVLYNKYWFNKHPEGLSLSLDRDLSSLTRSKRDVLDFLKRELIPYLKESANSERPNLKLYRGLGADEASNILSWKDDNLRGLDDFLSNAEVSDLSNIKTIPIGHHLGDLEQAMNYGANGGYVLEFVLKEGAEEKLFKPEIMALGKGKHKIKSNSRNTMSLPKISMCILQEDPAADYHAASESEGTLAGYLGIKSESNNHFSISIATSEASQLLFSSLIEDIRILGYFTKGSDGKNVVFHKYTGGGHTKADFEKLKI